MLSAVLRRKRALDTALEEALTDAGLSPRDAGFARAIAAETLRRFGQLDALIRGFVPKAPPPHKAGPALEILLAGACELLFLDVAPHAAVDGANRLAQADSKAVHFKGLINAVLRRVSREGKMLIAEQDAAAVNTPDWLWSRWVDIYGEQAARAIAAAHAATPPLDLAFKSNDTRIDLPDAVPLWPGMTRLAKAGRIEALPGFETGEWWVQDAAANLPARLFGDVTGARVLDLCAAPGGKTLQLAASGAQVTAIDLSPERLALIAQNLERLKLSADLVSADARDCDVLPAPFVLLDAPCTATGTIRRHPDLPWIKSAADIQALQSLQSELLDAAAEMTAPGGTLVYAVCSLEPEEGLEQVEGFLSRRNDFARTPISPGDIFAAEFLTLEGDLRTLPSHLSDKGGMDGFYAARLKRV